jgi:hypothetical protein
LSPGLRAKRTKSSSEFARLFATILGDGHGSTLFVCSQLSLARAEGVNAKNLSDGHCLETEHVLIVRITSTRQSSVSISKWSDCSTLLSGRTLTVTCRPTSFR